MLEIDLLSRRQLVPGAMDPEQCDFDRPDNQSFSLHLVSLKVGQLFLDTPSIPSSVHTKPM